MSDSTADIITTARKLSKIPIADQAFITQSQSITLTSGLVTPANPNRSGLIIYNNSSNSIYLAYGSPANSSTNMSRILASFSQIIMELPIYTGAIYGIRNAGSGPCLVTEMSS